VQIPLNYQQNLTNVPAKQSSNLNSQYSSNSYSNLSKNQAVSSPNIHQAERTKKNSFNINNSPAFNKELEPSTNQEIEAAEMKIQRLYDDMEVEMKLVRIRYEEKINEY